MSGGVYLVQGNGDLVEMVEQDYASEARLQELLAKYPNLLAGDQIDGDEPRRWLLLDREVSLATEEGGTGRWSVDHLFLDQDAVPTIVEVKRSSDTRVRREVVGQVLDYAANAVVYWPLETLRARFEEGRDDPEQDLIDFLDDLSADPELFWRKVKTNLQAGKVRLVFVADEIPVELRRIVEFINGQMDPAEVLAVEIKQYVGGDSKVLVPRVMGQTVEAQRKKSGTVNKPSAKGEAYREFFQHLIDELRELGFTKARMGQPQNWYAFAAGPELQGVVYSASFAKGGQARTEIYIDRGDAAVNKQLFDELASEKERLEGEFGEELSWERLDERRACRVAVYRPGSIEEEQQTLHVIRGWMIERLLNSAKKSATGTTTIKGTLNSTPGKTFNLQFFSNPSGTNEGKTLLGSKSVTTNGSGNVSFAFSTKKAIRLGQNITATATGAGGTSEFSAPRKVVSA